MNQPKSPNPTVALIGGGRMGRALIDGMIAAGVVNPGGIWVAEPDALSRSWWEQNQPECKVVSSPSEAIATAQIAILAVKPDVVSKAIAQGGTGWRNKLVMSVAAGISLAKLTTWLSNERVVRVMPNTPCLVGEGASAYCCAAGVSAADRQHVNAMLSAVGWAGEVEEKQMDAVTGLSGSGPAYICVAIEALADGGVLAGLPRDLAMKLATQTVLGTAKMVLKTGQHPAALKDAVASPGGTTIAGLRALEQNGVRAAFIEAVAVASQRSRELGSQ
jgi:pyrroline-5-carboxylate reductase